MDGSYFGNHAQSPPQQPIHNTPFHTQYGSREQQQSPSQNQPTDSRYPTNEPIQMAKPVSTNEELRAKLGTEATDLMPQFQTMPTLFLIAIILYFVLAPILMLHQPSLDNSSDFLQTQMWINCSLAVSFSVVYGIVTIAFPKEFVTTYRNFLLPLVLIVVLWLKGYFTYSNSLIPFCATKNKNGTYNPDTSHYNMGVIMWNTAKVPIAIFVTYVVIVLFPQTVVPFNEFFCGEEVPHPLVEFFSIGFWIGCATWPSEASCYFQILRGGCQPVDNIIL